ncbi:hypothetical protein COU56_04590 [Candidatus Pacearchaeota archaeon CG10_big_fil_rev_8_21_14_0_10_31_9]|nr:MAG: hypothetical protein COU56_04590 [Candidatus Pacearchaeota archaeon CG10_big_fil_rev_8_21_14_0_10_31_9]
MVQNRNKLIGLLIGNISNVIVHEILEKAISFELEISIKYEKEIRNSFEIAKIYRSKINPINKSLPEKDVQDIKSKIKKIVINELKLRISKGYKGINLDLIDVTIDKKLKELKL